MEHYITAISSHCNGPGDKKGTIHWILAVCKCGALFTETCTSTGWKEMGLHLHQSLIRHIALENERDEVARTRIVPRIETSG